MTTYSRIYTSVIIAGGKTISADHLNAEFDIIFNALDTGGIGSTQIAANAITSSELAADSVTLAKLDNTMIIKSEENWADTDDTKIPTVKAVTDEISGSFEENLSETTTASIFGVPTTTDTLGAALVGGKVYKVQCDGFLVVNVYGHRGENGLRINMDDTDGTTFYIGQETWAEDRKYHHITLPVPKDYFWQLAQGPATRIINWHPIGSGGCVKQ